MKINKSTNQQINMSPNQGLLDDITKALEHRQWNMLMRLVMLQLNAINNRDIDDSEWLRIADIGLKLDAVVAHMTLQDETEDNLPACSWMIHNRIATVADHPMFVRNWLTWNNGYYKHLQGSAKENFKSTLQVVQKENPTLVMCS
jgi:hypothetical protein